MKRSIRSTPTGPGSRGGRWHESEYRNAYQRAWRAAHPEYREREALRRARERARARGQDPADITESPKFPRPLPVAYQGCSCTTCRCSNTVPAPACGMCLSGLHE